ncbi:hypothetical protein HID58_053631 [Brassica napus]|uniref:Replication protein A OB domain-containing protein n=1 Tax=Brassica napus TaxID=3708 RepID=A0ABQ8AFZ1_BRANA|nr:hypothetical protein HID58_053631 [Brassica napus]
MNVLGQVLDCGAVETIQCAGGNQRKKLEFTLRDINDSRIPCCIWGKLTDTLHSACNQDDGLVTLLLRDTGDDKTLKPYESNEESQEYINKQIDQADKRGQRDKWLLYPTKNIYEMKASTQDNVSYGAEIYKVGKIYKDRMNCLTGAITPVQSETPLTITSVDEVKLSNLSQELNESVSTPSSKRKEDEAISLPDISSTSKKPCLMTVKVEKAEETG